MKTFFRSYVTAMVLLTGALMASGNLSSLVFYEYSLTDGGSSSGEFEVNRAYLTYENKLSDEISFKVQTDVGRMKNDPSNPHLFLFLKNAKVDYLVGPGKLTLGLQGMNMFSVQEKNWGYRFIEKSVMDKYGLSSSADMGIGYSMKLMNNINTSLLITNGAGYKKTENDDYKKVSGQVYIGDAKLSESGSFNAGGVFSFERYDVGVDTIGSKTVVGGFGGVKMGSLKVGGELNTGIDSEISDNVLVLAAYGEFGLSKTLTVFGRFDRNGSGDDFENYLIAGAKISPVKGLDVSPNIRIMDDVDPTYALSFQLKF